MVEWRTLRQIRLQVSEELFKQASLELIREQENKYSPIRHVDLTHGKFRMKIGWQVNGWGLCTGSWNVLQIIIRLLELNYSFSVRLSSFITKTFLTCDYNWVPIILEPAAHRSYQSSFSGCSVFEVSDTQMAWVIGNESDTLATTGALQLNEPILHCPEAHGATWHVQQQISRTLGDTTGNNTVFLRPVPRGRNENRLLREWTLVVAVFTLLKILAISHFHFHIVRYHRLWHKHFVL